MHSTLATILKAEVADVASEDVDIVQVSNLGSSNVHGIRDTMLKAEPDVLDLVYETEVRERIPCP